MKELITEFLYNKRSYPVQFFGGVAWPVDFVTLAAERGITLVHNNAEQSRFIRTAVWQLIAAGILIPGTRDGSEDDPRWISITDYGVECFEKGEILPYDPDGFIKSLESKVSNLDDIIRMYFEEAVSSYQNRIYLGAAALIGGAIERMIIVLTEEVSKLLPATLEAEFKTNVLDKDKIKKKYEGFIAFLERKTYKNQLAHSTQEQVDGVLSSITQFIRITRNNVGHPTGKKITRDEAHSYLTLAKIGIEVAYTLLDELKPIVK